MHRLAHGFVIVDLEVLSTLRQLQVAIESANGLHLFVERVIILNTLDFFIFKTLFDLINCRHCAPPLFYLLFIFQVLLFLFL